MESTIKIEIDLDEKKVRVVDQTDYAAQSVSLSTLSAKGLGTIRFDGAIVAQKLTAVDPLVDLQGGDTASEWFNAVLDSSGNVAFGTYSIADYSVRTALTGYTVATVGAGTGGAGNYLLLGVTLESVLSDGDSITISNSNVVGNNGVKTIAVAEDLDNSVRLYVDQVVSTETPSVSLLTFDITKLTGSATGVYAGCEKITPSFTFDADCDYGLFGRLSVLDTTTLNGQVVVSKLLTLMYPSWKDTANVTSATGGIVLNALSTGTWTILNAYTLTMTSGDLLITYDASIQDEKKVTCSGSLCGLLPCIDNLWKAHREAVKTGFSKYQYFVDGILLNYTQAIEYKKCGEYEKYQEKVDAIDTLLDDSGSECSCCDDDVLIDVVNATAGEASIIAALQAEIDALELRVDGIDESITEIGAEQVIQNEAILTVESRLAENSLIFTNHTRAQGASTWAQLFFDVPTSLFDATGILSSGGCVDIEIKASTGDPLGEFVLVNETTGSNLAVFTCNGDEAKFLIRLVCSAANQVSRVIESVKQDVSGGLIFGDTPSFVVVAWDFTEAINTLRLTCDDEDVQFVDMIKVTAHKVS